MAETRRFSLTPQLGEDLVLLLPSCFLLFFFDDVDSLFRHIPCLVLRLYIFPILIIYSIWLSLLCNVSLYGWTMLLEVPLGVSFQFALSIEFYLEFQIYMLFDMGNTVTQEESHSFVCLEENTLFSYIFGCSGVVVWENPLSSGAILWENYCTKY